MRKSTLGACIRRLRKNNSMTQAQLAVVLGVTDKAVSKWERELSYPDIALFPKLADVLGTTVESLLSECKVEYHPSKLLQSFEMSRDIMMPHMDGLEASRRIRQLPDRKKAEIPIIAMTTNVLEKDRNIALAAGMDGFVEKPVFIDSLFGTLQQYL